jgi:dephospho-CoA kinase
VLDIPLLFETKSDARCDCVLLVRVDPEAQRRRVLARPGMTDADFHRILARQMPETEKRARAHVIIDTGSGYEAARAEVSAVLRAIAPMRKGE